jgi:hypothetical protein
LFFGPGITLSAARRRRVNQPPARAVTDGPPGGPGGEKELPETLKGFPMSKLLAVLVASVFTMSGAFAASHAGAPMAGASGAKAEAKADMKADTKADKKDAKATKKVAKKSSKKTAKKDKN